MLNRRNVTVLISGSDGRRSKAPEGSGGMVPRKRFEFVSLGKILLLRRVFREILRLVKGSVTNRGVNLCFVAADFFCVSVLFSTPESNWHLFDYFLAFHQCILHSGSGIILVL